MDRGIEKRIAQASRAFGALRKAVFLDKNLSLKTKRAIIISGLCPQCTAMWIRKLDSIK